MDDASPPTGLFSMLSQDCWEGIITYLSLNDRDALSGTCKGLRAATEPLLYQYVIWDWTIPPLRRLLLFLRTIFGRPELASFVRHVNLLRQGKVEWAWAWVDTRHEMDLTQELHTFMDVVERGVGIIQQAEIPDAREWTQALYTGNAHAFGAVLISQLHNLKTLRIDYSFVWFGGYPGRIVQHALLASLPDDTLSKFKSLQLVDYGGNVPPAEIYEEPMEEKPEGFPALYNKDQFAGWFYLPALQHLAIWLRETTGLRQQLEQHHQKPRCNLDNISTLILARSTIKEDDALFLLGQTKVLRNLHLGLAYSWFNERVFQRGESIAQALESVSGTVERLSVGLEYYPCGYGEYRNDDGKHEVLYDPFYGFLKKFTRLQAAEIPAPMLLGFDPTDEIQLASVLPETLCVLGLRNDLKNVFECDWHQLDLHDRVRKLLLNYREATPFLSHIYLRLWDGIYSNYWPEEEKELQIASTDVGIHLDIVVDNLSPEFGAFVPKMYIL